MKPQIHLFHEYLIYFIITIFILAFLENETLGHYIPMHFLGILRVFYTKRKCFALSYQQTCEITSTNVILP
jgi:hypothetical protein